MRTIIPLGLLALVGCGPPPAHTLPAQDVTRVDACLLDELRASESASSDDPAVIEEVLAALAPMPDPPPLHLCANIGQLVLVRRSGAPIRLGFLPGHDPRYFEYSDGQRSYRVDNARFVAAVRRIGLSGVPERCDPSPPPVSVGVSAVAGAAAGTCIGGRGR
jgi:hypothetical protein